MNEFQAPWEIRNLEIGQILHLKSEIRNFELDLAPRDSPICDFGFHFLMCRIRPISKCLGCARHNYLTDLTLSILSCMGSTRSLRIPSIETVVFGGIGGLPAALATSNLSLPATKNRFPPCS